VKTVKITSNDEYYDESEPNSDKREGSLGDQAEIVLFLLDVGGGLAPFCV